MKFYEVEERLVAVGDDKETAFVWQDSGKWVSVGIPMVGKAMIAGYLLTDEQVRAQFPGARVSEIPEP